MEKFEPAVPAQEKLSQADIEAKRAEIFEDKNNRQQQVFDLQRQVFEEEGKSLPEDAREGLAPEVAASRMAHKRALEKTNYGQIDIKDANLTHEESLALSIQKKLNEIDSETEKALSDLSEIEKAQQDLPEVEEPEPAVAEKPKINQEDIDKI